MRIVYAYDRILPGTPTDSEQAVNTVAALGRRGVDIGFLLPHASGADAPTPEALREYYQVQGDFRVWSYPLHGSRFLLTRKFGYALAAPRRTKKLEADVVYTRNLATATALLSRGQRMVYDTHRAWPDHMPILRGPIRAMFQSERFVGAILHSDYARQAYLRIGIPEEKLMVAHNGYNPSRLEPVLSREQARSRVGLPQDRPIVVYTGHVNATKGLQTLLDIARRCPDILFVLVGSEGHGVIERAAKEIANVEVRPWQRFDKMMEYLYAADVLCVPPTSTPLKVFGHTVLPLKIFVYLAAGRPIFAPASPDLVEILRDGENAVLVSPGDLDEAVGKLRALVADGQTQERLAASAMRLSKGFTWDARAEKIEHFLRERMDPAGSPRLQNKKTHQR